MMDISEHIRNNYGKDKTIEAKKTVWRKTPKEI